jgi:hypothetical protein
MTVHRGRQLTAAIVQLLEGDGWIVGDGDVPDAGEGWQGVPGASSFVPYVVVHPSTGGVFDGSIGDPYGDARPDYVIHAYGATPAQCQAVNDAVFAALTSTLPQMVGRTVQLASPDVEGGVVRDPDAEPPIWYAPTRWRIYTTPA